MSLPRKQKKEEKKKLRVVTTREIDPNGKPQSALTIKVEIPTKK